MSTPGIQTLLVRSWVLSPTVTALATLATFLYLCALPSAHGWPVRRTLAFLAGELAVVVALQSGIDAYDDRLLTVHMVQHLLLIEVGPVLMLCGRPAHLALRTLPPRPRRSFGRALITTRRFATPAACLAAYAALVLAWHIPALFDAAVRDQTLHDAEHVCYVLAGLIVWWPLLGDPAPTQRLGAIGQLAYLTVAMLPMTLIGAYLDRDQSLLYPAYAVPARTLGVSAVANQQQAGAVMWVAGTTVMACVGLGSILAAMLAAERRQRARELHEVTR